MSKLDELRNLVADWFNSADVADKGTIDQLSRIKKAADDVAAEQDKLTAERNELLKDYKELVVHTSFNDAEHAPTNPVDVAAPSFEEALASFIKKEK